MSSGAALAGSPMSGGYAGAKATVRFISAYAAEEAARRAIPVRFVSVLPHITNFGTGRLGVRAYAARAGITEEEFIERAGATATPDQVARHVVELIADGSYSAPAYRLTSDGLRPLS
jgi:NAD(P)-dependent dehydrogenase (short-subunit alcohol dehydrogenase family)